MKKIKKQKAEDPHRNLPVEKLPEKEVPADPEEPLVTEEEDPDKIPDAEDLVETPPYEPPLPGEGP